ncbi:hypothetical protein RhiJN_00177 [Ceratobasidium sp. AG-Ba]|nr:hypothetical protein RhiJN_00177 [Ceratobasidium sp. AG-Ba]QRW01210.1 hypothetical protein RhiLY_00207 [Ceratobasidium sp. AG-Ba]
MPDWFAITGAITNVATAFDLTYRYGPETMHEDASKILAKVDEILGHSNAVLENHKGVLDDKTYEDLKDKYRELHWQMADESQGERAIRDEIIRHSRILSQLYASEETRYDRAQQLRKAAENYQTNVLSASERAHRAKRGKSISMFPDAKTPVSSEAPKVYTSWFSVFGRSKSDGVPKDIESVASSETPSLKSSSSRSPSLNSISTFEDGYIVAVTHLPDLGAQPTESQTGTMYRRMISFEGAGKRIDIIDPKHHTLSENGAFIDEKSLCSMTLLGERLLGGEVPENAPRIAGPNPAPGKSLESAIEDFRRMSVSQ